MIASDMEHAFTAGFYLGRRHEVGGMEPLDRLAALAPKLIESEEPELHALSETMPRIMATLRALERMGAPDDEALAALDAKLAVER